MDLFPLWNSLRIALISTVLIFFLGILAAYYIARLPRVLKGILDVVLTLPLVLPPTVVGYLLLRLLGPKRIIGAWLLKQFGIKVVMTWWSAIFATAVVIFPLMYRTVRGAFEAFDETLAYAGQTLGLSNTYIFWHIRMPYCRQGVLAGAVLAFARALGEYGATSMIAGYTPGKTATVSTTVYQLWQVGNDTLALKWVLVNIGISAVILLVVNMLEKKSLLSDFDGPILWVSHDLGECCRNCRTVCVMENGASGAVTDMESLVRRPATQSAARLTGCRNFLSARSCEGGVRLDGWDITLPLSTGDGTCTVAIPDSAVSLGAGPYRAQVFRTILDLNEASVLLRPTWDAAGPLLRVSAPKAAAPAEGAVVAFNLFPEQCLRYR